MLAALRSPRLWWSIALLWFIMLFIISSMPRLPPGPDIPFQDKVMHTGYYAIGGFCVFLALRFRAAPFSNRAALVGAIVFCAGVGWFDEWHQTFTPNRRGNDFWDWLADALGGVLGGLGGALAHRVIVRLGRPCQQEAR